MQCEALNEKFGFEEIWYSLRAGIFKWQKEKLRE